MKITVVGLGGVGGHLGAHLARRYAGGQDGVQVNFIARGEHLERIRQKGLQYSSPSENFTAIPAAATDQPAELGAQDLILFCVKTYHLEEIAARMSPAVSDQTVLITVLNGVDNADRLKRVLPQAQALNGGIYISATLDQPGAVRQVGGSGRTFFGAETGPHTPYRPLEALLKSAGIAAEYREDIRWAVWEKYLFISPLASATTYLNLNFGELLADPVAMDLLEGLLSEAEAVASAQGVQLPAGTHAATLAKIPAFPPATKTSMQVDYERGRPLEIETFTGYIVRAGRRLDIPVPLHEQIYTYLHTQS